MDKKTIVLAAAAFIAVMNISSFLLMGHDKRNARRGAHRVPEKTLFLITACFGGLGGVLGMKAFRHKTRHMSFRLFFPLLLIVQTALLAFGAFVLFQN